VSLTAQRAKDLCGVLGVIGFTQNSFSQGHGGVAAQHGREWQATALHAVQCGFKFEQGHTLNIGAWRFVGQHHLQSFGVFAIVGQQQLVANAQLLKQLAAAWALRGEVNEFGVRHK
jgi:hypothetical protein